MSLNTTFTRFPSYAGPCPRCGEPVPSRENQGQYPGALSRVDNKTHICSQCGQDEALYQLATGGKLPPLDQPARLNEEVLWLNHGSCT